MASSPDARAGGLRLHLARWKMGARPALLLHGMGANTHWWDRCAPLLSGLDAAALDFRGHGDSGRPADGAYSLDDFAEDVEAARLSLGWDKLLLVAHSMGARAAIRYAGRRPERIEKLVLVDFLAETGEKPGGRLERALRRPQPAYDDLEAIVSRFHLVPPGTLLSSAELRELGRHSVRSEGGRWSWKFDWRAFRLDYPPVWSELAAVRAPTLVVRGEHSKVMRKTDYDRVVAGLPDGRGVELGRAHHHVPLDAPGELAREISSFS